MNQHVKPEPLPPVVRAPADLPRRRWTFDEILKAEAAGVIDPDERFELIDGEIVLMASKGIRHEIVKNELNMFWGAQRPPHLKFGTETSLRLSPYNVPEPDFLLFQASGKLHEVDGGSVLLAVEVAVSSRSRDLGFNAALYAKFGVREYWVIEAETLTTIVHKHPSKDGFATIAEVPSTQLLVPEAAPEMSVRLADLQIE